MREGGVAVVVKIRDYGVISPSLFGKRVEVACPRHGCSRPSTRLRYGIPMDDGLIFFNRADGRRFGRA